MKIRCDICKTEYSLPTAPTGHVRCAVCGNVWNARPVPRRGGLMVFVASLCALLAAVVFAVAVIVTSRRNDPNKMPLVATISGVETKTENDGTTKLVVRGVVTNRSDDIYGFPDIMIILRDANDKPIAKQRFLPSATLLDSGQSVEFSHTVAGVVPGVKRVSVELMENVIKK